MLFVEFAKKPLIFSPFSALCLSAEFGPFQINPVRIKSEKIKSCKCKVIHIPLNHNDFMHRESSAVLQYGTNSKVHAVCHYIHIGVYLGCRMSFLMTFYLQLNLPWTPHFLRRYKVKHFKEHMFCGS